MRGNYSEVPDEPPYQVYVGNLPIDIISSDFNHIFADCEIEHVHMVRDKESDAFKGFAYVEFKDKKSMLHSLGLDNACVNGYNIRVRVAPGKNHRGRGRGRGMGSARGAPMPPRGGRDGGPPHFPRSPENMNRERYYEDAPAPPRGRGGGYVPGHPQTATRRGGRRGNFLRGGRGDGHFVENTFRPSYSAQSTQPSFNEYRGRGGSFPNNSRRGGPPQQIPFNRGSRGRPPFRGREFSGRSSRTTSATYQQEEVASCPDTSNRPRLVLLPRSEDAGEKTTNFVRNTSIFGTGRPREEVLKDSASRFTSMNGMNDTSGNPLEENSANMESLQRGVAQIGVSRDADEESGEYEDDVEEDMLPTNGDEHHYTNDVQEHQQREVPTRNQE